MQQPSVSATVSQTAANAVTTMSEPTAIIIGAAIAGAISIIVIVITQLFEQKKREKEQQYRKEDWLRDKLVEAYGTAIYYLIKLSLSSLKGSAQKSDDTRQHFSESQRYLNLLQVYQPDKALREIFKNSTKELAEASGETEKLSAVANSVVNHVKAAAENDHRIN